MGNSRLNLACVYRYGDDKAFNARRQRDVSEGYTCSATADV